MSKTFYFSGIPFRWKNWCWYAQTFPVDLERGVRFEKRLFIYVATGPNGRTYFGCHMSATGSGWMVSVYKKGRTQEEALGKAVAEFCKVARAKYAVIDEEERRYEETRGFQ